MPNSQNGWPVVPRSAVDERPLIGNVKVPNGVLAGDVAVIFRWLAEQYDRRVERLREGWCWGWFVKSIEGSSTISNHASGTAVDFNAPDNPMAPGSTKRSMTSAQIAECHKLERESDDVLRWGGDYVSRNDPMHWEIVGSRAAVKRLADKIRNAEPPRTAVTQTMTVKIPLLKQGDRDSALTGYAMITRMQRIIGLDDDGIWGPATTKGIAAWCKLDVDECKTLTELIARRVFGLA